MMNKFTAIIYLNITFFVTSLVTNANAQSKLSNDIRINQIQVLGTHNSYALPVDDKLLEYVSEVVAGFKSKMFESMDKKALELFNEYHPNQVSFKESLTYDHPSFQEQLEAGLRSLELDVYYDTTGNRFLKPRGYDYLTKQGLDNLAGHNTQDLDKPGFKVLHIPDVDFRSKYPTLKLALQEVKKWSNNNKSHVPIFILIEAKDSNFPIFDNPTAVLKYDAKAFDLLDKEIIDVIGRENIITPDDVKGNYSTLKQAVLNHNWPLLSQSRGKFVFLLLPSTAGINQGSNPYVENRPNLENRVMFVQSTPNDSYGAFLLLDNAIVRQEQIKEYVKQGYLVRTRADIDAYEAKINDKTRAKAAFSSGAQVISTDYFSKKYNPFNNDYFVELPQHAHQMIVNPINYKIEK